MASTDLAPQAAVSRQQYRNAMARLPAAVNIITTDGPAGRAGLTASAVCSLTDEPPMLIVCLNRMSRANQCAQANGRLAVNVLGEGNEELSSVFAGQRGLEMEARFDTGAPWTVLDTLAPVLEDSISSFDCEIDEVHEIGTHSVLYCRVVAIQESEARRNLIYHDRQYKLCPETAGR